MSLPSSSQPSSIGGTTVPTSAYGIGSGSGALNNTGGPSLTEAPHDERWDTLSGTAYRGPEWRERSRSLYWRDDNRGPGPTVMAAGTLSGDNVVNAQDEKLGTIKDLMIDVPTGRVAYAVLSAGGFLGMGDKLFAIPWKALQLDAANHRFILNVDKERLSQAPGFDKDNWPTMADETWATELHGYYGARPYWE